MWVVLPVLPTLWIIRAVVRHLRPVDDYQRLLLLQGLSVGFALAMVASLVVGFLGIDGTGVRGGGLDHLPRGDARLGPCRGRHATAVRNDLKVLRADRGWSQGALADRLDVSRQTVKALETGRYDPSLPLAFRIAQLFERRIESIFFPDKAPLAERRPGS